MQEPIKPDLEAFSGLVAKWSSSWPLAIKYLYGCEFAMVTIFAVAWMSRPLNFVALVTTYSFIAILGLSSTHIVRSRNAQTETENEKSSIKPRHA